MKAVLRPEKQATRRDYSTDFATLEKMEWAFSKGNVSFFEEVLDTKTSLLLRVHAVCMLADMKNEMAVPALCKVLRQDPSPLSRHEAAFSLGQLGFNSAVPALLEAMAKDESVLVRHESAVALGSIGDERAREGLEEARRDADEDVRLSAEIAVADLDFLKRLRSRTQQSLPTLQLKPSTGTLPETVRKSVSLHVPKRAGENALSLLAEMKLVDQKARIRLEGETLFLPLLRKPSSDEANRIQTQIGHALISRDTFEPKTKRVQSLEEAVEEQLPPSLIASLPSSFDIIGDIAVVEFQPELSRHERIVAEGILKVHKNLRTVFARAGPVSGVDRVRPMRHLVGDKRTTTVHREFGCRYKVDLSKAYFSPRLSTEHQRVAESVGLGECVVDMFAGVGPFSILIAKRQGDVVVHAVDSNPEAVRLLEENVRLNKQAGKVIVWAGDARAIVVKNLLGKASRVIMNLPSAAKEFVDVACKALKAEGGVLHYYTFADGLDYGEKALGELEQALSTCSWRLRTEIGVRAVRGVAPMQWQVVVDARVVPTG